MTGYVGTRINIDAQQKATLGSLNSYYWWQKPAFPFLVHPPSSLLQHCNVLITPWRTRHPRFTQTVKLKYRDKVLQGPKDSRTPNTTQTALITDASSQRALRAPRTAVPNLVVTICSSPQPSKQSLPLKAATFCRSSSIFQTRQQHVYGTQNPRESASYLCLLSPAVSMGTPGTSAAWSAFCTSVWGMRA